MKGMLSNHRHIDTQFDNIHTSLPTHCCTKNEKDNAFRDGAVVLLGISGVVVVGAADKSVPISIDVFLEEYPSGERVETSQRLAGDTHKHRTLHGL